MASFGSPISRDGTGTVRRRDIILSAREKQVYGQLWAAADKDNSGFITGADAVPFLAKSGLSPQVLGQIWVLADTGDKGVLGQQEFSIAVKLIAHVQNGKTPSLSLINQDAPLPRFEGLTSPAQSESPVVSSATLVTSHLTGSEPSVTNEDRTKYGGMFMACGPNSGLLDGDKAREVFLKSKLPVDKLSQIWSLADTKQRGSLDITDFTIAMYYIQHTMDGSIKALPSTLPPSILKACAGPGPASVLMASPVMSSQPIPRQSTGNNMGIHNPMVARQMTGSVSMTSSPLAKQNTGGANIFGAPSLPTEVPWDISADEKAKFDRFFDKLDSDHDGLIGGEEAGQFFMNSRLPASVLAQIWDLSDITGTGSLSRDEFAVAMFLINRKNATGAAIPKTLPTSLVPPSLRSRISATLSFPSEPIRSSTMPSAAGSQQFRRQSFDLLGDGPSLATSLSNAGVSHEHKDLMGAEDLTSKITSETGELASMQNQINNLGNVTGDLQAKRAVLETNLSMLSAQKQDISIRLNQIKTLHENERKSIIDLENALSTIQPQLIKLREELVVSERELAVARASRDEYLLSLNKDQDENNMIKTRLRQNNEETMKLREELEAKKKDTGRQKSLLEIARRQLATSDADKQRIIKEIENESEKAAQAARDIQNISTSSPAPSSPAPAAASSGAPPPPAPRGSRKEPPPPPASRGTAAASVMSAFARSPEAEAEEAFGIPPALRSPTGSFHSVSSLRNPQSIVSRQSTGSSPFDVVPRQTTGSSPFEPISRQGTGSSPFEPIPRQGTGMSANAPSVHSVGGEANQGGNTFLSTPDMGTQNDLWSPSTHAAHSALAGQAEVTKSPEPEASPMLPGAATLALAANQALPMSPPVSQDPFAVMAFPSMDTPPVTKMDFDSAFTGFAAKPVSTSSNIQTASSTGDGVRSAEAFAQEFPDIENVTGEDGIDARKAKRVSAFGFDDDFSAPGNSPFHSRKDDDSEFPPIVEVAPVDEDSTDDSDEDSDNEEAFVQAKSSIASPEPTAETVVAAPTAPIVSPPVAASSADQDIFGSAATLTQALPAPAPIAPVSTGSKKLTAADFGEFETSFGGSAGDDDFDSAFKGVELSTAPKVTATSRSMAGFDDGFDFNTSSFDDAFGGPSPFGSTTAMGAPTSSSSSAPPPAFGASFSTPFHQDSFGDMEFNTPAGNHVAAPSSTSAAVDLDEAFGGFGSGSQNAAATTTTTAANSNAFGDDHGFGDFEAQFSSSSAAVPPQASPRPVPAVPIATANPASTTSSSGVETTSTAPVAPKVDLPGVDELINMGFSRQQANDALSRYDTVERAANFLLEGGI